MRNVCAIGRKAFGKRSSRQGYDINHGRAKGNNDRSNDDSGCFGTAITNVLHGLFRDLQHTIDERDIRFRQCVRVVRRLYHLFRGEGIKHATRSSACG